MSFSLVLDLDTSQELLCLPHRCSPSLPLLFYNTLLQTTEESADEQLNVLLPQGAKVTVCVCVCVCLSSSEVCSYSAFRDMGTIVASMFLF